MALRLNLIQKNNHHSTGSLTFYKDLKQWESKGFELFIFAENPNSLKGFTAYLKI
jgi:hypothetical protein